MDIKIGTTPTLRLLPPSRWTGSIAGSVVDAAGSELETPTPVLDSVDTTVASAVDPAVVSLTSASGVAAGRRYLVTGAFGSAVVRVSSVDGATVTLVDELPATPEVGDLWQGIEVAVALTTASTGELAMNSRVIATSGDEEVVAEFCVARHPFVFPTTAARIRDYVASNWPSSPRLQQTWWPEQVREEAADMLRGRLLEAERYPRLYFSPKALAEVALVCVKFVLLDYNLVPGGAGGRNEVKQGLEFDIRDRVSGILRSAEAYDKNNDGAISPEERITITSKELSR